MTALHPLDSANGPVRGNRRRLYAPRSVLQNRRTGSGLTRCGAGCSEEFTVPLSGRSLAVVAAAALAALVGSGCAVSFQAEPVALDADRPKRCQEARAAAPPGAAEPP